MRAAMKTRWLDSSVGLLTLVALGVVAAQVFAGGSKCRTSLHLGTESVSCSQAQCIGAPAGTCESKTFGGFPRDVTMYTVQWNNGVATVTAFVTYISPGPPQSTVTTCACKVVGGGGTVITWDDDWCCDAVIASIPDEERTCGTMGTCQSDGCVATNPNCTLVVDGDGFEAEAACLASP